MDPVELVGLTNWTVAWTLLGGMGGYLLGRLARDVHLLANPTLEGERVHESRIEDAPRRWRPGPRLLIGLVIVILGVGTAVQGIVVNNRVEHLQQCQASYSNRFADALDARTDATQQSQQALDRLVATIGHNLNDKRANQAAIADAVGHYRQLRSKAKQQRATHPYPDPPREACH